MKTRFLLVPVASLALALAVASAAAGASALPMAALTALLEGSTVALVWVVALGWGRLIATVLRISLPAEAPLAARFALHGGLGFASLMTLVHITGLAGLVHPAVFGLLALAGLGAFLFHRDFRADAARLSAFLTDPALLLAVVPAAILLLAASCPPGLLWPREAAGYDALEYHLQIPREWLALSAIRPLPHNVYSYLPLNLEILSLALMSLRGGAYEAMLAIQWLHASFALATALLLGSWIGARTGWRGAGWAAGLAFLAVPWTLVTGSLAYNEAATAFLIAAAWVLLWEGGQTKRMIAAAGIVAGAAAGTKLTAAGFGVAPMLAVWALFRDREEGATARSGRALAVLALVFVLAASAIHAPYVARNAAWTGNPVFPFATRILGRAHWSAAEEWRWMDAHRPKGGAGERSAALWSRGLADPGFGPVWWLAGAAGLALALSQRRARPLAAAAAAFVGLQVVFWIAATHLQGRFLHPLAVPLSVAIGLGVSVFRGAPSLAGHRRPAVWSAVAVLALGHGAWHLALFREAAPRAGDAIRDPWVFADVVEGPLLAGRKVLLVAEARAFYYPPGTVYATPFEVSPFARFWREAGGDPGRVIDAMRQKGITLVVVNWDEADRLRATYGLDPEIDRARVASLVRAGARPLESPSPLVEILEIPP